LHFSSVNRNGVNPDLTPFYLRVKAFGIATSLAFTLFFID
jgi:hypothetical protein